VSKEPVPAVRAPRGFPRSLSPYGCPNERPVPLSLGSKPVSSVLPVLSVVNNRANFIQGGGGFLGCFGLVGRLGATHSGLVSMGGWVPGVGPHGCGPTPGWRAESPWDSPRSLLSLESRLRGAWASPNACPPVRPHRACLEEPKTCPPVGSRGRASLTPGAGQPHPRGAPASASPLRSPWTWSGVP
jgi:hypothetical protein